jgi:hypothetical protein
VWLAENVTPPKIRSGHWHEHGSWALKEYQMAHLTAFESFLKKSSQEKKAQVDTNDVESKVLHSRLNTRKPHV